MKKSKYSHILWDWNGTLLDDVQIVVDSMNQLLEKRGLSLLTKEAYKDIFTFPVKDYYQQLGFDFNKESFEELAREYIFQYDLRRDQYKLFEGVEWLLTTIKGRGLDQSILSACREEDLQETVAGLGLAKHFTMIAGLDDHFAYSKVERGKECLIQIGLKPKEILLIGDTIHDYQVAKEITCDCLLIACGHQSCDRLHTLGVTVVSSLFEIFPNL